VGVPCEHVRAVPCILDAKHVQPCGAGAPHSTAPREYVECHSPCPQDHCQGILTDPSGVCTAACNAGPQVAKHLHTANTENVDSSHSPCSQYRDTPTQT
jgi:hypothetical protein